MRSEREMLRTGFSWVTSVNESATCIQSERAAGYPISGPASESAMCIQSDDAAEYPISYLRVRV
jgi:hypothetical protein